MLCCYEESKSIKTAVPITIVFKRDFSKWLGKQSKQAQAWIEQTGFVVQPGEFCLLPNEKGSLEEVVFILGSEEDGWPIGRLPLLLPNQTYCLNANVSSYFLEQLIIIWGLGAYQFSGYKVHKRKPAKLILPEEVEINRVKNIVLSSYFARDLINTPSDNLTPLDLGEVSSILARKYNASIIQFIGKDLIENRYAGIYHIGRACVHNPRLIDLHWGDRQHPKVTLVGKGVCFDTGGLNIKSASQMKWMKKDMAGAAHVLSLAQMIMTENLPIRLRVLIPAVENAVSREAYHPGDVITMRNGRTVEINNTDAEGRVILAEALVEASSESPDLLIDFATLTNAARVGLGTEIPAMFSNDDQVVNAIYQFAKEEQESVWRLPLYQPYRDLLRSHVADLSNAPNTSYGGAIAAALFLKEFISGDVPWLHFDIMGWNVKTSPGKPEGGEVVLLRTLFSYLKDRFA